eukprot:6372830-Amphidinium_carterae.1
MLCRIECSCGALRNYLELEGDFEKFQMGDQECWITYESHSDAQAAHLQASKGRAWCRPPCSLHQSHGFSLVHAPKELSEIIKVLRTFNSSAVHGKGQKYCKDARNGHMGFDT